MTDWLNFLPEGFNYWALACFALGCLNVYQYAHTHKLIGMLDHLKLHGHAPDGKVLVSDHHVIVDEPARTPAETLASMKPGGLPKGWHMEPDIQKATPQPGVLAELADAGHAGAPQYDPAAVLAARSYRVASSVFGPDHLRTNTYIAQLAGFPHWSDVLKFAGGAGYDRDIELDLTRQFQSQKG